MRNNNKMTGGNLPRAYEKYYGFREPPFHLQPDPDFLYLSEKHRAALNSLELAIFNQSGFCVVSGDIGAGKTTLVRELLNRLDDNICVGLVTNTHLSFGELLQTIMAAFGLKCDTVDNFELHKAFTDFIIQQYANQKHTLLIIDEAQHLSIAALEELRMLSNINADKDFLLQIILVGQKNLHDKLTRPELRQFAQRIAVGPGHLQYNLPLQQGYPAPH
jgi:general secretion pathway protein A